MPIDKQNLRDLLTAIGIIGAAMLFYSLLFARPAHAFVVSDPPVEANTGKIAVSAAETTAGIQQANQTLSQDLEQNTLTAKSVVTGGGAGAFQGQAQYLDSLTQMMASGVADAQTFASTYPGWVDSGSDAAAQAKKITAKTLTTYADALGVVQSQAADSKAEDAKLQQIEACSAGAGASGQLLAAVQCNTEAQLANSQQIQMERQLLETLITVEATKGGIELDIPAQRGANEQAAFLGAAKWP